MRKHLLYVRYLNKIMYSLYYSWCYLITDLIMMVKTMEHVCHFIHCSINVYHVYEQINIDYFYWKSMKSRYKNLILNVECGRLVILRIDFTCWWIIYNLPLSSWNALHCGVQLFQKYYSNWINMDGLKYYLNDQI